MKIFLTGASSGIGRATAEALLARGHEVWGTSRDPARLPTAERFHAVALDLGDPASIEAGFGQALAEAGALEVMINNAGSGYFGAAESLSDDEVRAQFQTIVFSHLDLCRRALTVMRNQTSGGLIINVTSLAAELPVPFMAAYNAAKAAMASFTMTMQLELAGSKVRLVDLQPADIKTNFNAAVIRNGPPDSRIEKIWQVVDRNMQNAPPPELVARRIAEIIDCAHPPPRMIVGDFFQSKVAPVLFQLLPQRVRLWGLKKYYDL